MAEIHEVAIQMFVNSALWTTSQGANLGADLTLSIPT
jgi:hypothetical protein